MTDDGPGIPLDEQSRLFRPFERLAAGKLAQGTGLGLSIVKTIVDAHSGLLEVESAPGRGSVFRFVLPFG